MTLRFIGTESEFNGGKLESFGQSVTVSDADGKSAIVRNLPALPADLFAACGFTAEDLDRYKYPATRRAPDDGASQQERSNWEAFSAKWFAAREALHEYREQLRAAPAEEE